MIPHLAHEQNATLSVYSAGETYVSASAHAAIVRESVNAAVSDRLIAGSPDPSLSAAGALERESDAAEHVAAVSVPVVTTESDAADADGVEHLRKSRLSSWHTQR